MTRMMRFVRRLTRYAPFGALLFLAVLSTTAMVGMAGRPPAEGRPAPDFTLQNLEGATKHFKDYRGNIILLNFWATWCEPCIREMPAMQQVYEDLKHEGFVVLAINELENVEKVARHIDDHGHTFPVLLDTDNSVANKYGVYGLPVTVFIDKDGIVREYVQGGTLTEAIIRRIVDDLRIAEASIPKGTS